MRHGIFLPESTFSADSLTVSIHPLSSIACINFCALIKDPVVDVRVWWNMETLKHQACTIVTVSQLAFPREGNLTFPWEKSYWDNTVVNGRKSKVLSLATAYGGQCHFCLGREQLFYTCAKLAQLLETLRPSAKD